MPHLTHKKPPPIPSFNHLPTQPFLHLSSIHPLICPSFHPSVHGSTVPSLHTSICSSPHPLIPPPPYLPIYLSICPFTIHLPTCACTPHPRAVPHLGTGLAFLFFFFSFFWLFWAALVAYESSQARSQIGATAAGLHHSHSNARSEPCLRPTP